MAKLKFIPILIVIGVVIWLVHNQTTNTESSKHNTAAKSLPIPVEVASVVVADIERIRTFSGNLQPVNQMVVAPKVSGRVEQLNVDLADPVSEGQVVAELDDAEFVQAVRQAEADLAVAVANQAEAKSLLAIADRELARLQKLRGRGLGTESELDAAKAEQLAKKAHVEVTRAQSIRAQSALETARIQLGYTQVKASWRDDPNPRVVAERLIDEGETVAANTPLIRVVQMNPIKVLIHATEQDYPSLQVGQSARLATDAHPKQLFDARIVRISQVFQENTRQAQVELWVENPQRLLKPGMFVRLNLVLDRADSATVVPELALSVRDEQQGVFRLNDAQNKVEWIPVEVGIQQGDRVQILSPSLTGQVVTLGQQLLADGASVSIPELKESSNP